MSYGASRPWNSDDAKDTTYKPKPDFYFCTMNGPGSNCNRGIARKIELMPGMVARLIICDTHFAILRRRADELARLKEATSLTVEQRNAELAKMQRLEAKISTVEMDLVLANREIVKLRKAVYYKNIEIDGLKRRIGVIRPGRCTSRCKDHGHICREKVGHLDEHKMWSRTSHCSWENTGAVNESVAA